MQSESDNELHYWAEEKWKVKHKKRADEHDTSLSGSIFMHKDKFKM
jgi:hypothetical protein